MRRLLTDSSSNMKLAITVVACVVAAPVLMAASAEELWSVQRISPPPVPVVRGDDWSRTAVDRFILAKLREYRLQPQPEADRHALIRRVTLGLTGLPPAIEEVRSFVSDTKPQAYERLVDRLLKSPRFGERWGRHWLDVVRFGESKGALTVDQDRVRGDAFEFRDAVIRAMNDDVPFDRFVRMHLDESDTPKEFEPLRQFIHLGTQLQDNADPNDKQFHRLNDMVSTTGLAFLGISFGCARCHDHPVDPMSTEEYYQFTATFFDQVREAPKASSKKIPLRITEPRVLRNGSWQSPGEAVTPGFLRVISSRENDHWLGQAESRLGALGQWLTDAEHGAGELMARVIVNRVWHYHFGQGLVQTPNDFGRQGAAPAHPELLDFLARRLIEGGWRLKPIHRLILTSAVYRQGGTSETGALEMDAGNTLLWHWQPRRLEAEAIRDQLLFVAGELRPKMYGPSIPIGDFRKRVRDEPKSWRRSVYLQVRRSVEHPTLSLFDTPDTDQSVGRRTTGATAEGALFALNAPFVWDLAKRLAKRVEAEAGTDPAQQVGYLYHLALSRPPTSPEVEIGLGLLDGSDQDLAKYCQLLLGLNEFLYVN